MGYFWTGFLKESIKELVGVCKVRRGEKWKGSLDRGKDLCFHPGTRFSVQFYRVFEVGGGYQGTEGRGARRQRQRQQF